MKINQIPNVQIQYQIHSSKLQQTSKVQSKFQSQTP